MKKETKINILSHLLTVLITIITMHFIYMGSVDSTFANSFSFGSTISSIILSVVAIVYTFVDGSKNKEASNKIIESAEIIQNNTNNLNETVNILGDYQNSFKVLSDLKAMVENLYENNREFLGSWREIAMTYNRNIQNEVSIDSQSDEFSINIDLDKVVRELSYEIKSNLLFLLLSYRNNRVLDLDRFQRFYNDLLISEALPIKENIAINIIETLNLFKSLELINYEYNNVVEYNITITYFNEKLEELLQKYIPSNDFLADAPQLRYFGWVYDFYKR
ncbi:MAG: hypothetical protein ACLU4S_02475 [Clostridium perfringens]